ncbi:unnamed protein product [Allacma fusca]|uniref:Uncharacterized protein n=1 Tax=Allacma fusca TaxID=39272 RepID=A0A8J2K6X5_9HEXA|nr:unnamed protein product [Allacma fusca]
MKPGSRVSQKEGGGVQKILLEFAKIRGTESETLSAARNTEEASLFTSCIKSESASEEEESLSHARRLRARINRQDKLVDNAESDDSSGLADNNAEVAITFDQQELEEFQEAVLKDLAELNVNQDNILVAIKPKSYREFECDDYQAQIQPCCTENELMNLEMNLKNQEFLKQLERYLTSFGGKELKKTLNGILSRIISDELAKRTTLLLTGKGKAELEFWKFINIYQIVFHKSSVQTNYHLINREHVRPGKIPGAKTNGKLILTSASCIGFALIPTDYPEDLYKIMLNEIKYVGEVKIVKNDDCRNSTGDVDNNSMRFDSKAANTNILSYDQGMECDDTFRIPGRSSISGLDDSQIMYIYNVLDDDVEIT